MTNQEDCDIIQAQQEEEQLEEEAERIEQEIDLEEEPPEFDIDEVAPEIVVDELLAEYEMHAHELEEYLPSDTMLILEEAEIEAEDFGEDNDDHSVDTISIDQDMLVLEAKVEVQEIEEEELETYELIDTEQEIQEEGLESVDKQEENISIENDIWEEVEEEIQILEEDQEIEFSNINEAIEELTAEEEVTELELLQLEKEIESIEEELITEQVKETEDEEIQELEENSNVSDTDWEYEESEGQDYYDQETLDNDNSDSTSVEAIEYEETKFDQEFEDIPTIELVDQTEEEEIEEPEELDELFELDELAETPETVEIANDVQSEDEIQFQQSIIPSEETYPLSEMNNVESTIIQPSFEIPNIQSIESTHSDNVPRQSSFGLSFDESTLHKFSINLLDTEISALERILEEVESPRLLTQFHPQLREDVEQLLETKSNQIVPEFTLSTELVSQGPALPEPPPYDFQAELDLLEEEQENSFTLSLLQSLERAQRTQLAASIDFTKQKLHADNAHSTKDIQKTVSPEKNSKKTGKPPKTHQPQLGQSPKKHIKSVKGARGKNPQINQQSLDIFTHPKAIERTDTEVFNKIAIIEFNNLIDTPKSIKQAQNLSRNAPVHQLDSLQLLIKNERDFTRLFDTWSQNGLHIPSKCLLIFELDFAKECEKQIANRKEVEDILKMILKPVNAEYWSQLDLQMRYLKKTQIYDTYRNYYLAKKSNWQENSCKINKFIRKYNEGLRQGVIGDNLFYLYQELNNTEKYPNLVTVYRGNREKHVELLNPSIYQELKDQSKKSIYRLNYQKYWLEGINKIEPTGLRHAFILDLTKDRDLPKVLRQVFLLHNTDNWNAKGVYSGRGSFRDFKHFFFENFTQRGYEGKLTQRFFNRNMVNVWKKFKYEFNDEIAPIKSRRPVIMKLKDDFDIDGIEKAMSSNYWENYHTLRNSAKFKRESCYQNLAAFYDKYAKYQVYPYAIDPNLVGTEFLVTITSKGRALKKLIENFENKPISVLMKKYDIMKLYDEWILNGELSLTTIVDEFIWSVDKARMYRNIDFSNIKHLMSENNPRGINIVIEALFDDKEFLRHLSKVSGWKMTKSLFVSSTGQKRLHTGAKNVTYPDLTGSLDGQPFQIQIKDIAKTNSNREKQALVLVDQFKSLFGLNDNYKNITVHVINAFSIDNISRPVYVLKEAKARKVGVINIGIWDIDEEVCGVDKLGEIFNSLRIAHMKGFTGLKAIEEATTMLKKINNDDSTTKRYFKFLSEVESIWNEDFTKLALMLIKKYGTSYLNKD